MSFSSNLSPAVLLLEDGTLHHGTAFGQPGTTAGELCFNTGMTGYQEVFTDPSYFGQVLIMNSVHIGNYGVNPGDVESDGVKIRGLIGRNLESQFSRKLATGSLEQYLKDNQIVCINGVDTRSLVSHIRIRGAMNCIISSEITGLTQLKDMLAEIPSMAGLELASRVSTDKEYDLGESGDRPRIAVIDYGIKRHILTCMLNRGAYIRVFPARTPFERIRQFRADGYFLSNGPGDPAAMDYAIRTVGEILQEEKPLFGICLGHQLLALAQGVDTFKMHHGHRGLNHPVKNLISGRCEITTQNHGFGVDPESLRRNSNFEITHVNLNDQSIEGIRLKNKPVFSVQYHPESTPGPHDSRYLFDEFLQLIRNQARTPERAVH
jgi:carbamoyl-phosphate synthase small subunit